MRSAALDPQAHPRRCGEHATAQVECLEYGGSPPQVRGTSKTAALPPARATGSPPQVRGTSDRKARHARHPRLTPAGAGNMNSTQPRAPCRGAHPRRCGEHWCGRGSARPTGGSPPQVRGTSKRSLERVSRAGLTPAGAGNIEDLTARPLARGAHPRRCGEHPTRLLSNGLCTGSPPQVRGTSSTSRIGLEPVRLTPAGAGNITASYPRESSSEAHPRRCGEHPGALNAPTLVDGSPPQVRGT